MVFGLDHELPAGGDGLTSADLRRDATRRAATHPTIDNNEHAAR